MSEWSWKVASSETNTRLNLRYEPGNWGDVLKGTWAVTVARALPEGFRYLDPFAGAPDYPLLEPVARRLSGLPKTQTFVEAQRPWLEQGLLASTATLVGGRAELFDLDPERRGRWPQALPLTDAAEALGRETDFLLWDPYDFAERWSEWTTELARAARRHPVLIYLYNKACRGVSQTRQYESMRRRFEGLPVLAGRIPSDEWLPRAWHEMLLVDGTGVLERVRDDLTEETRSLASLLAERGAVD